MSLFPSLKVKAPKQSRHDLSHKRRCTMAPGVLYPLMTKFLISGDKINFSVESLIKTYPALAPIMGSFKLQLDYFFAPLSLYNQFLHHNSMLNSMDNASPNNSRMAFPTFQFPVSRNAGNLDIKYAVAPGSMLSYLGFPAGFASPSSSNPTQFNAIPVMQYIDIVRNYYANQQELNVPYAVYSVSPGGEPDYSWSDMNLASLDEFFALTTYGNIDDVVLSTQDGEPYYFSDYIYSSLSQVSVSSSSHSVSSTIGAGCLGMFRRCYLPDVKNVILNANLANAVANIASVAVGSDSTFTVDQFNLASKLYKVYSLSQLGGSRFKDWLRLQYNVQPNLRDDMPTFLGSTSTEVVFEDVIQNSASTADSSLGDLAGRGRGYGNGKTHTFRADQPGYFMIIASLVPRVDYSQSLDRIFLDTDLTDLFVNHLNGLGFQDVLMSDLNGALPSNSLGMYPLEPEADAYTAGYSLNPMTTGIGKQPAWINYMTDVNHVFGDFVTDKLKGWTLQRTFPDVSNVVRNASSSATPIVPSATPGFGTAYVNPTDYNYAFADTSVLAENFLCQFAIKFWKQSNVSKRIMPTL